jgi:hypothetical protein
MTKTTKPAVKQTAGIGKGTPGPGRPKGVGNKTTLEAKSAIALVAQGLGGADRMLAWVQEDPANEKLFWSSIYPKLLPLQVANAEGEEFKTRRIVEFVKAK